MTRTSKLTPPKATATDKAIGVAGSIIRAIPFCSAAVDLCTTFVSTPMQRRTSEWQQVVGEILDEIQNRHGMDLSRLQDDPAFIDVLVQASRVALTTSRVEKHEALRNAILNAGLPSSLDASERQMFIHLIDQFTEWHLRLLRFFSNPRQWLKERQIPEPNEPRVAVYSLIFLAFPGLDERCDLCWQICAELRAAGLVQFSSPDEAPWTNLVLGSNLTPRGEAFVAFVTIPPDLSESTTQRAP